MHLFPATQKKKKGVENRSLPKSNPGLESSLNEILQMLEIHDGKVCLQICNR